MLRIRNWSANFETHESRKLKRLEWVSIPNDLIDLRYRMLIDHPDGAAHFGAWIVIVETASTCKVRGTLVEGGSSLTPWHLSLKSGLPSALFEAVIPRLLKLEWLEEIPDALGGSSVIAGNSPGTSADSATLSPEIGEDSGKTSAYIDRDTYIDSNSKTHCSSYDERGVSVLELSLPRSKPVDEVLEWFNSAFWSTYPRKVGKPQALKAARRHGKTAAARVAIMECLERQLPAFRGQLRADGDFRKHPASWLNSEPWNDPEEAAPSPTVNGGRYESPADSEVRRIMEQQRLKREEWAKDVRNY